MTRAVMMRSSLFVVSFATMVCAAGCGGDGSGGEAGNGGGSTAGSNGNGGGSAGEGGTTGAAGDGAAGAAGGNNGMAGRGGDNGMAGRGGNNGMAGRGGNNGMAGRGGNNGMAGRGGNNGMAGRGGNDGMAGRGGNNGMAGRGGNAGGGRGGSGGAGGTGGAATFAQVATILGASCGTGDCHDGTEHVDLRNNAGLYARIVDASPTGSRTMSACTSRTLIVPGNTSMSVIAQAIMMSVSGCTNARMPDECPSMRPCLTAAQISTITSWINAGAPM